MAEKAEDLNLPITVVSRIIKDALPDGVSVSKEAKIAIARAASVFVLYATTTANSYATKTKRKTLAATDIMEAMKDMEFEDLVQPLQEALDAWKQTTKPKKAKVQKSKSAEDSEDHGDEGENEGGELNGEEPPVVTEIDESSIVERLENINEES